MAEHNDLGNLGETLAVEFLQKKRLYHSRNQLDFSKSRSRHYRPERCDIGGGRS